MHLYFISVVWTEKGLTFLIKNNGPATDSVVADHREFQSLFYLGLLQDMLKSGKGNQWQQDMEILKLWKQDSSCDNMCINFGPLDGRFEVVYEET